MKRVVAYLLLFAINGTCSLVLMSLVDGQQELPWTSLVLTFVITFLFNFLILKYLHKSKTQSQ